MTTSYWIERKKKNRRLEVARNAGHYLQFQTQSLWLKARDSEEVLGCRQEIDANTREIQSGIYPEAHFRLRRRCGSTEQSGSIVGGHLVTAIFRGGQDH